MANEFHAAAEAMLDPEVLADHRRVRSLTAKRLALQPVAERWDAWRAAEREAAELQAMGNGTDAEFARMAREELPGVERRADALLAELQRLLVTSDGCEYLYAISGIELQRCSSSERCSNRIVAEEPGDVVPQQATSSVSESPNCSDAMGPVPGTPV
jgi:hypothetical protein